MRGIIGVVHRSIGFPIMWKYLSALDQPCPTSLVGAEGTDVAKQRNDVVETMYREKADWVLFVDDDHIFDPRSLMRLWNRRVPIVSALIVSRKAPYRTVQLRWKGGNLWDQVSPSELQGNSLVEVDLVGMGFTLIRREVFDKIPRPWFKTGEETEWGWMSEDAFFCWQAKRAGFSLYADCGVRVPHLAVMALFVNHRGMVSIAEPSLEAITFDGLPLILDSPISNSQNKGTAN